MMLSKKLSVSRSLVAAIETGRLPPTSEFVADLMKAFPGHKTAITAAAKPYAVPTNPNVAIRPNRHLVWEQISELCAHRNLREADILIEREWNLLRDRVSQPSLAVEFCIYLNDLYLRLGLSRLGPGPLAFTPLQIASFTACNPDSPERERVAAWEMLIRAFELNPHGYVPDIALNALNYVLQRLPTAGELWHLKAVFHIERENISDANAALAMAQLYGASPCKVRYARGLILTEWNRYAEAITELSGIIFGVSQLTTADIARARAIRAFALFGNSQTSNSMEEFTAMEESLPNNAWAHYYRAQCHFLVHSDILQPVVRDNEGHIVRPREQLERDETALMYLEKALQCQEPALSPIKQEDAESIADWFQAKVKACRDETCNKN